MIDTETSNGAIIPARLTYDEAQAVTQQIRDAVENVWTLLKQAHDGKAWAALGHRSWEDYVNVQFKMSRAQSYRLLNYAEVNSALSPIGDTPMPTESQARPLVQLPTPEAKQEAWQAAVEASGGNPTAKHVEAAVQEVEAKRPAPPVSPSQTPGRTRPRPEPRDLRCLKEAWANADEEHRKAFISHVARTTAIIDALAVEIIRFRARSLASMVDGSESLPGEDAEEAA